jgi:hypothetical protein
MKLPPIALAAIATVRPLARLLGIGFVVACHAWLAWVAFVVGLLAAQVLRMQPPA